MDENSARILWARGSHEKLSSLLGSTTHDELRALPSDVLSFLGVSAALRGEFEKAKVPLTLALRKDPKSADHALNLGNCFKMLGDQAQALKIFDSVLQHKPDKELLAAACACAEDLRLKGDLKVLSDAFAKKFPEDARARYYYGLSLYDSENFAGAISQLQASIELDPVNIRSARIMTLALLRSAMVPQANDLMNQIISSQQYDDKFMIEASSICVEMGASVVPLGWFSRVADKASIKFKFLISEIFRSMERRSEALELNSEVLGSKERHLAALLSKISMLRMEGRFSESEEFEDKILGFDLSTLEPSARPNPWAAFSVVDDPEFQHSIAKIWGDQKFNKIPREKIHLSHSLPGGRPRVGFFSPDFGDHPVGHIVKKLFQGISREVDVVCFSQRPNEDYMTGLIKKTAHEFHSTYTLGYPQLRKLAIDSGLSVMVDLAGYTTGGQPGLFSKGLAPKHVSYLGYSGTTGAVCYDEILLDGFIAPDGCERFYSERVRKLECSLMSVAFEDTSTYETLAKARYGLDDDAVLYCCLSSFYKISMSIIRDISAIMRSVPNGYILLGPASPPVRKEVLRAFEEAGLRSDRIIFSEREPTRELHLGRLKGVDVFLDTFPYNAHSLAADALSAGVPLVTRAGASYASRVAGSLLSSLGFHQLIATNSQDYQEIAVSLGASKNYLNEIRFLLQERVKQEIMGSTYGPDFLEKILSQKRA